MRRTSKIKTREEFLSRRSMLRTTAIGLGGAVVGVGFTAPACGVSKEKAVKVAGLVIALGEESIPLFNLLGAHDLAITIDAKVIPALEKLKDALEDADIPSSQSLLANVRSVLNTVRSGMSNLPQSPRLFTIMGILASVNMLLLTVEAFIDSETPIPAPPPGERSIKPRVNTEAIKRAYEASWVH